MRNRRTTPLDSGQYLVHHHRSLEATLKILPFVTKVDPGWLKNGIIITFAWSGPRGVVGHTEVLAVGEGLMPAGPLGSLTPHHHLSGQVAQGLFPNENHD
jgi:hypothetical protein